MTKRVANSRQGRPREDRFFDLCVPEPNSGCWLWIGTTNGRGYGSWEHDGAHRKAYELFVGPIPEGLQIDHLCRVKLCVNPKHMEVVTHRVNTVRGDTMPGKNTRKATCLRGHPLVTRKWPCKKYERRVCPTCHNERSKRRYHARLATLAGTKEKP